jgi:YfiH family protein
MNETKWYQCEDFERDDSTIQHAFFTRCGGVSEGVYESCNFGYGSQDSAQSVDENRRRAMQKWCGQTKESLVTLSQTHSAEVVHVDERFIGHQSDVQADAMVTRTPGIALGILTADCTPVLFADHENKVIGAAHAGWGGAIKGICVNVIKEMLALGACESNICVAIGPTIMQPSYEVGAEFLERFTAQSQQNSQYFSDSAKAGHYLFDLPAYVINHIKEHTKVTQISNCNLDTYANEDLFFSYRRTCHKGESDYGRNVSAVMV